MLAAALVICLAAGSPVFAKGAADAVAYIKARQQTDGGFAEPDAASDPTSTCWAMLAGAAASEQVKDWKNSGKSPVDFLASKAGDLTKLDDIELTSLALSEAGADPRNLAGKNLVSLIVAQVNSDGRIGDSAAQHCWGMIALLAAGEAMPSKSAGWLLENQRADGGWGESDAVVVADTGLAIEALAGIGQLDQKVVSPALKLLKSKIGPAGGFSSGKGPQNTMMTASIMRAIVAAGQDPSSDAWSFHGNTPVMFIDSMQTADGHYQYSKGVESQPAVTTSTAVPADLNKSFPLNATPAAVNTSSGGVHDLGTTGAGIIPAPATQASEPGSQRSTGVPAATGAASAQATFSGLWLFLIVCAVYVVTMAIAALIAAKLYQPAPAQPASVYPPQVPPPAEWPPRAP